MNKAHATVANLRATTLSSILDFPYPQLTPLLVLDLLTAHPFHTAAIALVHLLLK